MAVLAAILPNAKPGEYRDDSEKVGQLGLQLLLVDADPTGNDTPAPIGSLASWDDGGTGKLYVKTGAGDQAWGLVTTS